MDGKKWFKFYGQDWMTDMKVLRLTPEDRLCYITLLCLASSSDNQGVISNCDEESLIELTHLPFDNFNEHNPFDEARGCLERFEKMKMITLSENGDVTINAFIKRQETNLTVNERVAKHREKHKKVTNVTQHVTTDVTNVTIEKRRVEKSREEKKEEEDASAPADSAAASAVSLSGFKQFWEIYPKKEHKSKASAIWAEKKISVATASRILDFVSKASKTDRWKKGFIPCPDKFLGDERWEDDLAIYADRVSQDEFL